MNIDSINLSGNSLDRNPNQSPLEFACEARVVVKFNDNKHNAEVPLIVFLGISSY